METPRINKIAYIVQYHPEGAAQLLEQYGYEAPTEPEELLGAVQELIQTEGRKAIHDLLELHPDKHLILEAHDRLALEQTACPNCAGDCNHNEDLSHDSFSSPGSVDPFQLSPCELKKYYQELKSRLEEDPEDDITLIELDLVANELKRSAPEKKKESEGASSGLLWLGLAFITGIIVSKL